MHFDRTDELRTLLSRRILILDGAMGTMIQRYKLGEAEYRGQRFAGIAQDVKGNNELLSLTRPQVISEIHELPARNTRRRISPVLPPARSARHRGPPPSPRT